MHSACDIYMHRVYEERVQWSENFGEHFFLSFSLSQWKSNNILDGYQENSLDFMQAAMSIYLEHQTHLLRVWFHGTHQAWYCGRALPSLTPSVTYQAALQHHGLTFHRSAGSWQVLEKHIHKSKSPNLFPTTCNTFLLLTTWQPVLQKNNTDHS